LFSFPKAHEESVQLALPQDCAGTPASTWTSISEEVISIRNLLDKVVEYEPDDPPSEQDQVEEYRI
jgi:hypothetical protein